jgi:hypothetical protein
MCRRFYVGMDVHKETIVIAVFSPAGREPDVLERVANDEKKLRRFFECHFSRA